MECQIIQARISKSRLNYQLRDTRTRVDFCTIAALKNPMIVCENYPESAIQSRSCKIVDCVVGKDVVKDTASDLRTKLKIQGILFKIKLEFLIELSANV